MTTIFGSRAGSGSVGDASARGRRLRAATCTVQLQHESSGCPGERSSQPVRRNSAGVLIVRFGGVQRSHWMVTRPSGRCARVVTLGPPPRQSLGGPPPLRRKGVAKPRRAVLFRARGFARVQQQCTGACRLRDLWVTTRFDAPTSLFCSRERVITSCRTARTPGTRRPRAVRTPYVEQVGLKAADGRRISSWSLRRRWTSWRAPSTMANLRSELLAKSDDNGFSVT